MIPQAYVRKPAVAGQFYPASGAGLKNEIVRLTAAVSPQKEAMGCVLPHAGYMYSGLVAGRTLASVRVREKAILLGPNHTGRGMPYSVMTEGSWETPLGRVKIDSALARSIRSSSRYLEEDAAAHAHEHSLEVELPFLQYFNPGVEIVPIAFAGGDSRILKEIGRGIASAVKAGGTQDSILFIASSDMTHYEPARQAREKDERAIEAILALDEDLLLERVEQLDISMCGWAPVVVFLSALKGLGAKTGELVTYQTSGEITGDDSSVVGYAGIIIS